ncbi:hypothetical protein MRB53_039565 [Persea americana]|nr:hypothetical protein MRB53_039565 [Persea americana]
MAQTMTAVAPSTPRSRFGSSIQYGHSRFGSQDDVSMADGLPSIDFGFDDLRERMSAFTARFDDFIARGRKRVLEERNAFRISAVEIAETIAKETQETAELREAITTLQSQKEEQLQRRTDLEAQVRTVQADIKERKEAQAAHHKALDAQARQDIPELRTWENLLGLRISAGGTDCDQNNAKSG